MNHGFFSQYGYRTKVFVKEASTSTGSVSQSVINKLEPVETIDGDSAKEFYENLVSETVTCGKQRSPRPRSTTKRKKSPVRLPKVNEFLKLAQNNEFRTLKLILEQHENAPLNETDDFGWTALMCAACSGAQETVEILLKYGADLNKSDKTGNTAMTLAKRNNFKKIFSLLKNWESSIRKTEGKLHPRKSESVFCQICQETFSANISNHECSTHHLLSTHPKPMKTFYGIPENNKGFQMLLKAGWNRERGLGPEESGIKFPIKAQKTKKRVGIGGPQWNESTESTRSADVTNNSIPQKSTYEEKQFERNFRLQFT